MFPANNKDKVKPKELEMFKSFKKFALPLTCMGLGAVFMFTGCEVNQGDVTAARDDVAEERDETQQAREEANREINEAERDLEDARHKAMRPNYDEDQSGVDEQQEELEETRQQQNENVREEERETDEAKAEAERLERELAAKNARETYVADVESKIETIDERIAAMEEQSENLEGEAQQEMDTNIELLEVKRDKLSDALSDLQGAEVLEWESHKAKVEQALERIDDKAATP